MVSTPTVERKFRPEIQGLRAVAALLVAVFHIWLGRVSGGVDVFFVVSGFLIATTLVGHLDRWGEIRPLTFLARLARRLLPAALAVLAFVLVVAWVLMPRTYWAETAQHVAASALYYENWQLASESVDYLAQFNEKTPVQHYWAMSVQGQFYLIWLAVFVVVWQVAARTSLSRRGVAIGLMSTLFVVSLAYSVWSTGFRQPFAYFDTGARVWEFALGGLLAMVIGRVRLPRAAAWVVSWIGLVGLCVCGIVLSVGSVFPGYAALWPAGCAVLILLGGSDVPLSAGRLLATKPMVWLGNISYGIYLWHWVLLMFYVQWTGVQNVVFSRGAAMIAASVVLAWLTNVFVEKPIQEGFLRRGRRPALVAAAGAVTIVGLLAGGAAGTAAQQAESERQAEKAKDFETALPDDPCWGARALVTQGCELSINSGEIFPDPATRGEQRNLPCRDQQRVNDLTICALGVDRKQARARILLVGDSHSINARTFVHELAKEKNWYGEAIASPGCVPSATPRESKTPAHVDRCKRWTERLAKWINAEGDIDIVLSMASNAQPPSGMRWGPEADKVAARGYQDWWKKIDGSVGDVVVIRDWPHQLLNSTACIQREMRVGNNPATGCARPRNEALHPDPAVLAAAADANPRTHAIDLTEHFCDAKNCYAVIGHVWTYLDARHITRTFAFSLAPYVVEKFDKLGVQP